LSLDFPYSRPADSFTIVFCCTSVFIDPSAARSVRAPRLFGISHSTTQSSSVPLSQLSAFEEPPFSPNSSVESSPSNSPGISRIFSLLTGYYPQEAPSCSFHPPLPPFACTDSVPLVVEAGFDSPFPFSLASSGYLLALSGLALTLPTVLFPLRLSLVLPQVLKGLPTNFSRYLVPTDAALFFFANVSWSRN